MHKYNLKIKVKKNRKRSIVLATFLFICTVVLAQNKVSGLVKDTNGEPLIGVSITEVGTQNGTITDALGNFVIETKPNAKIQISYLGYTPLIIKAGQNKIVTLVEDTKSLNEVVVVGYGSMRRKDVTSSITTIQSKDLNQGVYTNPAQLLQGRVAGLTVTQSNDPNASPSITLRGASTLREGAAQEPYYIIDGMPGVSLSTLLPSDIESIDVLRDASATAIYGSKAANGVIVVTTKKGKKGKANICYNGYVAFDRVAKNWNVMDATQYRAYAKESGRTLDPLDYVDETTNIDWQKEVQRTGVSHCHDISMNGGTDKTTYNASVSYLKNNGVIKKTSLERLIGRAFVETKTLNDRLTLSFNLNTSVSTQENVPASVQGISVYDAMTYFLPISPIKNADGSWFENTTKSQYYNPVSLIMENTDETISKRLLGNANVSLKLFKGLTYNLSLAYQNEQLTYNKYNSTKALVNKAYNGYAQRASIQNKKKMLETYFNYEETFSSVHNMKLMAGYSWEESDDNDGFQLSTYDYFNDELTYNNLSMGNKVDLNGFGDWRLSTLRMISIYGRANYSYNGKYMLQASVRRDGSSAFGSNNRWATFPSVSAAWRITEEKFMKDQKLFDDLKIRSGYGVSGNSLGFDAFTAIQRYQAAGWYTNSEGEQYHQLIGANNANPDLKWERTGMFNLGLDFSVLHGRLSGSIEYYDKLTKDMIIAYAVSTTKYLYGSKLANVGEVSNKGFEITINAVPVQTREFVWQTSLNVSHNKNEVKKIKSEEYTKDYIDEALIDAQGQSNNYQQIIKEGYPIGQFYTFEWAGYNDKGVSQYYEFDENGNRTGNTTTSPQKKDRTFSGCAQPKLTLGWNNTFSYKNWSVNAFFQGTFGNKILDASRAYLSNASYIGLKNLLATFPSTDKSTDVNSHILSDRYLENGDYLRLSTLSVGYNFRNIGSSVNSLRVYATCNNVFCITGYKGLDPEVNLGGVSMPGIDNRQTYPRTRTYIIGININF